MPTLVPVPLYTGNEPYHYTVDNKPLEAIIENLDILNQGVEAVAIDFGTVERNGTWGSLELPLDVNRERGKTFSYLLKFWAMENKSATALSNTTRATISIIGSNSLSGVVSLYSQENSFFQETGSEHLTITITSDSDRLLFNFSGYTGTNGFVLLRFERYGH